MAPYAVLDIHKHVQNAFGVSSVEEVTNEGKGSSETPVHLYHMTSNNTSEK